MDRRAGIIWMIANLGLFAGGLLLAGSMVILYENGMYLGSGGLWNAVLGVTGFSVAYRGALGAARLFLSRS